VALPLAISVGAFTLLKKHEIDYVMIEDRRIARSKR